MTTDESKQHGEAKTSEAFVRIESWAGSQRVRVAIVSRTAKRITIRFLEDCIKGKAGSVHHVHPSAVTL